MACSDKDVPTILNEINRHQCNSTTI